MLNPSRIHGFQKSDDGLYRWTATFGKRRPRKYVLILNSEGKLWTEKKKQSQ